MSGLESALVFDATGKTIYEHVPFGRTSGFIPDSRGFFDWLYDNVDIVHGIAHLHPWKGWPVPSQTDVTTFSAIERGLGKRLVWPIATLSSVRSFVHIARGQPNEFSLRSEQELSYINYFTPPPFNAYRLIELSNPKETENG